jgi:hypothetical protein
MPPPAQSGSSRPAPPGFTAIGCFFCFGALMAALAGSSLAHPGTRLDRMWALNPVAYQQLRLLGVRAGSSFLVLSAVLLITAIAWFRRRRWGWTLAALVLATQVVGDLLNALRGDFFRGAIGFVIAGALLLYLLSPRIRAAFNSSLPPTS